MSAIDTTNHRTTVTSRTTATRRQLLPWWAALLGATGLVAGLVVGLSVSHYLDGASSTPYRTWHEAYCPWTHALAWWAIVTCWLATRLGARPLARLAWRRLRSRFHAPGA